MSITDHLDELRKRIFRILIILGVFFFICYGIGEHLTELLLSPLREALGTQGKVVFLGLLDKVLTQFQLALWGSIIFSSPFWFYQLWAFIKPGLYENEIKVIRPFIFISFLLFCLGICFGHFLVFPFTFQTILAFGVSNIEATIDLRDYIVLASKVLVFLGFLFQLPNVLVILCLMGVTSKAQLIAARRYVITAFAIIAALATPPDVITMLSLWIPLVVLYEIGVGIITLFIEPMKRRKLLKEAQ